MFMSVKEAAEKWNCSIAQVKIYCAKGIVKAEKVGLRTWAIAKDQEKPIYDRKTKTFITQKG